MQKVLLKLRYFKRGLSKPFTLTLFLLLDTVRFNEQSYQNQKWPGTSDQSVLRLQGKFIKMSLLVISYLTKSDGL